MNGSVKVLGLAVGIWAGGALADVPQGSETQRETTEEKTYESTTAAPGATHSTDVETPGTTETGSQDLGTGGSGDPSAQPVTPPSSEGSSATTTEEPATGGSADPNAQGSTVTSTSPTTTSEYSPPVASVEDMQGKKKEPNLRGVQVMLGGGVEGYTGALAPRVEPGAGWGVTVAFKPTRVLGIELGYSGAVNELSAGGGTTSGADMVRNGGQVAATFGLAAVAVQPYVLAGVGINHYDVRAPAASGFRSDTSGSVPLGGGLRTHLGPVALDARVLWNVLFDNELATLASTTVGGTSVSTNGGRYQGMISLGSNF